MANKRKAISCKLIGPSKSNPGYFKYHITIQEKDGNTTTRPAYGTDMQDAISRLIWNERIDKVSRISEKNKLDYPIINRVFLIMLGILTLCVIGPSIWSVMRDIPVISIVTMSLGLAVGVIVYWITNWVSKR